jgi:hypothetical protein
MARVGVRALEQLVTIRDGHKFDEELLHALHVPQKPQPALYLDYAHRQNKLCGSCIGIVGRRRVIVVPAAATSELPGLHRGTPEFSAPVLLR